MFGFTQFELLLFTLPAIGLAMLAQMWVSSAYSKGLQFGSRLSGYQAARLILDRAGLHDVQIEPVDGHMTDHYDPRDKVLRLSSDVFHGRTLTAVGIAAHEAGHAIQDGVGYVPLIVRNFAVPAANFGSGAGGILMLLGVMLSFKPLLALGIVVFSGVVFFQLINLPVEFNASTRAKRLLVSEDIVPQSEMGPVKSVLNAAALTYVAGTLQAVLTLVYYVLHFTSDRSRA
ncbi:zinc metallopeptidase [Anatilimnocola floriformis]|uniref:zinc metallopeptidase n=1 Tax=Anatilimnocola floriformis TaxID=2948575 RepID=UPI0020C1FA34|nr:zinc metallopeptidase [Anatilimnocola floriformis]